MGHQPRKRFSQNFLHDQNIIDKIAQAISPKPTDTIIEIGPGQAALTKALLPQAKQLFAIELDRDLAELLPQACAGLGGDLQLYQGDALKVDFSQLPLASRPYKLVGNLPYNISTPLIFHALADLENMIDMTFLLQKEVVDRMVAEPGNKQYGRLSVMVQYHCEALSLFDVGPNSFYPAPKVTSSVVQLRPRQSKPITAVDLQLFSEVVKEAFTYRRKTLQNALKDIFKDRGLDGLSLAELGQDPKARAEQLTVSDFVQLSNALFEVARSTHRGS